MSAVQARRMTGRLIAGGVLVLLGVLFTLDNFGLIYAGDVLAYWPLALVGVGLAKVLHARHPEQRTGGVVLIAVGALLLTRTLHLGWFRLREIWPVLLLVVGALLIWQALTRRRAPFAGAGGQFASGMSAPPGEESASARVLEGARAGLAATRERTAQAVETGSVLNEFALMGGGDRIVRSTDFRGGEVTAIMGGFHIDLRGAGMAGDSATLEVFTFWGGVDLKVPEDWNVVLQGTPILGVFTNSARSFPSGQAPTKTLVIRGAAIMGGVEVKN